MDLSDALNSRITGADRVVPVHQQTTLDGGTDIVPEQPRRTAPVDVPTDDGMRLYRPLRPVMPTEVGGTTMERYPNVEYTPQAWQDLLARVLRGTQYMIDHPEDQAGYDALGLYTALLQATESMSHGHMIHHVMGLTHSAAS